MASTWAACLRWAAGGCPKTTRVALTLYVVGGRSRKESEVSLGVSPLIARGGNGVWVHGGF
jgi:hypothetical protein